MYYTALNTSRGHGVRDQRIGLAESDDLADLDARGRPARSSRPTRAWYRTPRAGRERDVARPVRLRATTACWHMLITARDPVAPRLKDGILGHATSRRHGHVGAAAAAHHAGRLRAARGARRCARSTTGGCSSSPATRRSRARTSGSRSGTSAPGSWPPTRRSARSTSPAPSRSRPTRSCSPPRSCRRATAEWVFVGFRNTEPEGVLNFHIIDPLAAAGLSAVRKWPRAQPVRGTLRRVVNRLATPVRPCGSAPSLALMAASLLLRTGALGRGLLDRRGHLGRDRLARPARHPGRARPGRQPAAVLPAAARLDAGVRHDRGGHARAQPAVRAARDPRLVLGRDAAVQPPRGRASPQPAPRARRSSRTTRRRRACTRWSCCSRSSRRRASRSRSCARSASTSSYLGVWLALLLYTHTWGVFMVVAMGAVWLHLRRRGEVDTRDGVRLADRARGRLPAVAAGHPLPGPAHRRAVGRAPVAAACC